MSDRAPISFSNQVESAVMMSGLPDYDLAHGAGLLADPTKFTFLTEQKDPAEKRRIYGVTALSLDYNGEVTFRTATFGIQQPELINQVDAMGTTVVINFGTPADKSPRTASFATSAPVLSAYYYDLKEAGKCTLGGAVVRDGSKQGTLAAYPFMSSALSEYLDEKIQSKLGKLGTGLRHTFSAKARESRKDLEDRGIDHSHIQKLGMFSLLTSSATKRGGPVVVDREFVANI